MENDNKKQMFENEEPDINIADAFLAPDITSVSNDDKEKPEETKNYKKDEKKDQKPENKKDIQKEQPENNEEDKQNIQPDEISAAEIITGQAQSLSRKLDSSTSNKAVGEIKDTIKELIEQKILLPLDIDKDIDDYTKEELKELLKLNIENARKEESESVLEQFIDSLPEELQKMIEYHVAGGFDIKQIINLISKDAEMFSLDPDNETDAKTILAYHLRNNLGMSDDEVDEEIELYEKAGKLTEKARRIYDAVKEKRKEEIENKIKEAEKAKEEASKKIQTFIEGVKAVSRRGKLKDNNADKTVLKDIVDGLTSVNYESITGKKTNLLGYLIEQKQFIEPDYDLIVEATWLLKDPEGYKKYIMSLGESKAAKETLRKLKTASYKDDSGMSESIEERTSLQRKLKPKDDRSWLFSR